MDWLLEADSLRFLSSTIVYVYCFMSIVFFIVCWLINKTPYFPTPHSKEQKWITQGQLIEDAKNEFKYSVSKQRRKLNILICIGVICVGPTLIILLAIGERLINWLSNSF